MRIVLSFRSHVRANCTDIEHNTTQHTVHTDILILFVFHFTLIWLHMKRIWDIVAYVGLRMWMCMCCTLDDDTMCFYHVNLNYSSDRYCCCWESSRVIITSLSCFYVHIVHIVLWHVMLCWNRCLIANVTWFGGQFGNTASMLLIWFWCPSAWSISVALFSRCFGTSMAGFICFIHSQLDSKQSILYGQWIPKQYILWSLQRLFQFCYHNKGSTKKWKQNETNSSFKLLAHIISHSAVKANQFPTFH